MAKRKEAKNGQVGSRRRDRSGKPRDIVGELLSIDDLKKVSGGDAGCKTCITCNAE